MGGSVRVHLPFRGGPIGTLGRFGLIFRYEAGSRHDDLPSVWLSDPIVSDAVAHSGRS